MSSLQMQGTTYNDDDDDADDEINEWKNTDTENLNMFSIY